MLAVNANEIPIINGNTEEIINGELRLSNNFLITSSIRIEIKPIIQYRKKKIAFFLFSLFDSNIKLNLLCIITFDHNKIFYHVFYHNVY